MQDPSAINLAVGQPNFQPPQKIMDALHLSAEKQYGYTPTEGITELQQAIQQKLQRENKTSVEKVIVTTGAIEAIFDSLLAHLKRNDEIILFSPHYQKYCTVPNLFNVIIKHVPLTKEKRPDVSALENIITSKTKIIILNSPNNPTGIVYSSDEIKHIIEHVEKNNLLLISDEVYEKYVYDGKKHLSPGCFSKNVLTINSLSKTYGLPGLRLGYLAGTSELIDPVIPIHRSNTTCSPYSVQMAALTAFSDTFNIPDLHSFSLKRKRTMEILDENSITYIHPEGTFYLYIHVPKSSLKIAAQLLEKKVLVMPGEIYHDTHPFIRISYAVNSNKLEQGLQVIKRIISL
jgi:aspartate aminotransferase